MTPERFRESTKAIPTEVAGAPNGNLVGRNIFDGSFFSPMLIARRSALQHNLKLMREFCLANDAVIAPHAKTHMAPELIARQIKNGAWGITVANAVQARTIAKLGVTRILIANELVNKAAIDWAFTTAATGTEIFCFVDSLAGLSCLDTEHQAKINVLVEVGGFGKRSGVRQTTDALALAREVSTLNTVNLAGVAAYEGVFLDPTQNDDRSEVRKYLQQATEVFAEIAEIKERADNAENAEIANLTPSSPPIFSAGGSACFDDVVAVCGPTVRAHNGELVLRSGCYLSHDHGIYSTISPFAAPTNLHLHPKHQSFQPALELVGQVTSRPEATLALIDIGKRDASFDEGLPQPLWWCKPNRREQAASRKQAADTWRVFKLMDQHMCMEVKPADALAVGDYVAFGISHPCTTFDKWRHFFEVDDQHNILAVISTEF